MKLVADEGLDKPIVDHLRSLGYEIIYILEVASGASDEEVLAIARKEKAVLLTLDTDFGELVYRLNESTYGVLLLRISGLPKEEKQQLVASVLSLYKDKLAGNFSVATMESIRIRKL